MSTSAALEQILQDDVAAPASRSRADLDFWIGCIGAPVLLVEKASLTVISFNPNAATLFGRDETSAAPVPIEDLVGREASSMLSQIWSNAPPGVPGEPFLLRARIREQERLMMVQVTKVEVDEQQYRLFTFTDAPPQGSVALAGWQENIISMLNWLPFGFEIARTDDQIQFANSTFKQLFGYSQDEIDSIEDWWRLAYPDPEYRAYARSKWRDSIDVARLENREMTPFDLNVMTATGIERRIQFRHRTIGQFNVNLYIDVTQERAHADQLRVLANTDPLTGILNRRVFFDIAEDLFASPAKTPCFGILMLDIDFFKSVNDTYGHRAGDLVLIEFTRRCQAFVPAGGQFARLGGEEFAMIFPAADPAEVVAIAEQIRLAIADHPFEMEDRRLALSVSIGATAGRAGQETFEAAILRSDKALYAAKRLGRNRTELHPD